MHEGTCGNHMGARALTGKALRSGYYWPSMRRDAKEMVMACESCQRFSNIQRQPATEMTPVVSPWPFAQWGLDIVGPLPPATAQRKFVFVAVDYFTRWVEAEAVPKITQKAAWGFVWKNLVCRFGVPQSIVTDHGRQFDNAFFKGKCEETGIRLKFSSVAHPQANGQVEVTNRTLLHGLKTKLGAAKGLWPDLLPGVLWCMRTTPSSVTGETPFKLAYGEEAVVPVEIGSPSLRVQAFDPDSNNERMREQLDVLDEVRSDAHLRTVASKEAMARGFASRVKHKDIQVGRLVLRKAEFKAGGARGKLSPNWEGPYIVAEEVFPGTFKLKTEVGTSLPNAWNAEHLRPYYV